VQSTSVLHGEKPGCESAWLTKSEMILLADTYRKCPGQNGRRLTLGASSTDSELQAEEEDGTRVEGACAVDGGEECGGAKASLEERALSAHMV
jgi:hypothetical protein